MSDQDSEEFLLDLNQRLRKGWTAHVSPEGRIYYMNHETKISTWLPPVESWDSGGTGLPYGWETAIDKDGKTYYINHMNRTTTYENPRKEGDEEPPLPREVQLIRDPQMGFGFVAGSEKPVIVRFVTEGGPNEHKLMPGDQIMKINGEDVMCSPREHVIEMIRSCKETVNLLVCQPQTNNTTRKSALLTAAKKAKLKNNPSRVRFSEGVIINGSPLYSPSPVDGNVPFLPNVLKVFLENGQTKSFKYDSTTTVQDVLNSLFEKLSITCVHHFCLATEHVKITRRNRLTVLNPEDTLAKIASKPGAHHLRCVFRVTYVPKDAYDLLQKDPIAFEYLYMQCCNDVVEERFTPELKYDIALRLTALNMQQHCLSSGIQNKVTVKVVERECGLEQFVPVSLLETMKLKELRKLLGHFLKQNQSLIAPGQKRMTPLQAKLHYLKIISELPSYGSKCFATNLSDSNPEITLLVSPRFGISQISCLRNTSPITLARIEEISSIKVKREDEYSCLIELSLKEVGKPNLKFSMEEKDADEFILLLKGYFRLFSGRDLHVEKDALSSWQAETVPSFHSRHIVKESPWSYPPPHSKPGLRTLDLAVHPPPYVSIELRKTSPGEKLRSVSVPTPLPSKKPTDPSVKQRSTSLRLSPVDHNMNETTPVTMDLLEPPRPQRYRPLVDERHPGIDYQTVISMELLEDSAGDVDVDVYEARNDEVIRRVSEMSQILAESESYLEQPPVEELPNQESLTLNLNGHQKFKDTLLRNGHHDRFRMEQDPDYESSNLKPADSLVLLTQSESRPHHHQKIELDDEELSPSESDTDTSTPNESPLHRSTPIRNSINAPPMMIRRDSSFGLHSPDLLPNIPTSGNNILDILKHLQAEEVQLPFAEETLCLDPDIIDLTMIPPPVTPDAEFEGGGGGGVSRPPEDFVGALFRKLEDGADGEVIEEVYESDVANGGTLHGGSLLDSVHILPLVPEQDLRISSIDSLIATLTVPPPPPSAPPDDLSAFIVPPPPSASPGAADAVIARFMAAADDIRSMFDDSTYDLDNLSSNSSSSGYDTLTSLASSESSTPVAEAIPVAPRVRTSCVDVEPAASVVTSPASTTSSDGSVVLLADVAGGSVDSLLDRADQEERAAAMARSASWSSLPEAAEGEVAPSALTAHPSLRRNHLRRSFRAPNRVNGLPRTPRPPDPPTTTTTPYPQKTSSNHNGLTVANGGSPGPFHQAQKDVSAMVSHLRKATPSAAVEDDPAKLGAAKDALANESRQFVTCSKLFVKSAAESSERVIENMAVCVALLNRMAAIGELIALRSPPGEVQPLVQRLEEVATAFFYTVDAAREAVGLRRQTPALMKRATDLATALTSLMRTLRAMC